MKPTSRVFIGMAIVSMAGGFWSSAWAAEAGPLKSAVSCIKDSGFKVIQENRWPEGKVDRYVDTPDGQARVSVVDGYRLMLADSRGVLSVNLKVEESEASSVSKDREVIEAQMQKLSGQSAPLTHATRGQVEILALTQPDLKGNGPLAFLTLFNPAKRLVASAYILNGDQRQRLYDSYEQFQTGKDAAIAKMAGCLEAAE